MAERNNFEEAQALLIEAADAIRERAGEDSREFNFLSKADEYIYTLWNKPEQAAQWK